MLLPSRIYLLAVAVIPIAFATPRPLASQLEPIPNHDSQHTDSSSQDPPIALSARDLPWGGLSSTGCGCDRHLDRDRTTHVIDGLKHQVNSGGFKVAKNQTWTMFSGSPGDSDSSEVVMFVDNHGDNTYTLDNRVLGLAFTQLTKRCGEFVAGSVGMTEYKDHPERSHAIGYMRAVDFDKDNVVASIWAGTRTERLEGPVC